jgi:serine/threonine-protein kinase
VGVAAKFVDINQGRQRIDRYELVGEIASGGMATVYLARLTGVGGFQRFFAVKRLHPHLAGESGFVEMFLDEARLAAKIHHPNVVPILEVGTGEHGYYLVMEYVEGDTMARLLARAAASPQRRLPVPIALRIGIDMLQGLHAAHELHDETGAPLELVHRDVSPQNVLVGIDGVVRITDFGVAHAASRLTATRVGQLKGKIAYMAPEQANGSEELDRRADVFSAGIVIWEALAARRLFKAENEAATLSRVLSASVPDIGTVCPLPPGIVRVVMAALDRDPNNRPPTCAAFADVIEKAATGEYQPATSRELAQYVEEVLGREITEQREAVRAWVSRSEHSYPHLSEPPPSGVSGIAASSSPTASIVASTTAVTAVDSVIARQRRWPLWLALLLLLGAAGIGAFTMLESSGESRALTVPPAPLPEPSGSPAAEPPPSPTPLGSPAPGSGVEEPPLTASELPSLEAAPPEPSPATRGQPRRRKSKPDVDLTNPYR